MRYVTIVPVWKESPFLRLIPPFAAGLLTQWYCPLPSLAAWLMLLTAVIALVIFSFTPISRQFRTPWINGFFLYILLFTTGVLLLNYKDIRRQTTGMNMQFHSPNAVLVTIEEPLSEKDRSYKTVASVQAILSDHTVQKAPCMPGRKILLYFKKDRAVQHIQYGNQLILVKPLQPVKNTGNPGAFDYRRYCIFQGIQYQVYLQTGDYAALKIKNENLFRKFLLSTQQKIVKIIKEFIPGHRESGLAEAMLIGYKEDLDKSLLQSYSNTGVVHIIAISGLHLGLIYWLLMWLCKLPGKTRLNRYLQPILIIAGLWLFSCLSGGSPSVLRSAVMFTCLVIGQSIQRKIAIYNTLAASAFLLLCYNPFWLWDAGFQLSYAAVLSLAIFMKPIYNLLFFQNKIADSIWKAMAVTLAAQVLTIPIAVYQFHQFPNFFLIANLLAVPLSSIILLGEILLCAVSMVPAVAGFVGYLLHHLIKFLNSFIECINRLPYASMQGLQIDWMQAICLYAFIAGVGCWLLQKKKPGLWWSLCALLAFTTIRTIDILRAAQQEKLIVYNVPQHQAMDIMLGQQYFFKGDSTLVQNRSLQQFHLQPSRWLHRVTPYKGNILAANNLLFTAHSSILLIDRQMHFKKRSAKIPVDLIILSQNAPVYIDRLANTFTWRQLVFDNSNGPAKVARWKRDCARLGLPCFCVADKGAFVFNLY